MNCRTCGSTEARVYRTIKAPKETTRELVCGCGDRWQTTERELPGSRKRQPLVAISSTPVAQESQPDATDLSVGGLGGLPSGSLSSPDSSQQSQQVKAARTRNKPQATAWFERFWTHYPRKVSRLSAIKAWHKQGCEERAEMIVTALVAQLPGFAAREPDKVPHASSWLNGERWTDAIEAPKAPGLRVVESFDQAKARQAREAAERTNRELDNEAAKTARVLAEKYGAWR